jgi:hypothetical protein
VARKTNGEVYLDALADRGKTALRARMVDRYLASSIRVSAEGELAWGEEGSQVEQ